MWRHEKFECTAFCMHCLHYKMKAEHSEIIGIAFKIWMHCQQFLKVLHSTLHTECNTIKNCWQYIQNLNVLPPVCIAFIKKIEAILLNFKCNCIQKAVHLNFDCNCIEKVVYLNYGCNAYNHNWQFCEQQAIWIVLNSSCLTCAR